ncbi:MAG: LacI family DNA-binding transcriptional regulator [Eubacteriales bacterium]|nr:LacI family DNA-binding transcriptional regulator [Eubacteriales bacterium]
MAAATIKDIAKMCGVGVSTVSRALNNHPDINPQTRTRIMQVIAETGFVPNNSAINLKKTDSRSIALLVKGISNPFFSGMIQQIEDIAERQQYTVTLRHVEAGEDEAAVALRLVRGRPLRGIIFLGGNFTHDEAILRQLKVPFVFSTIGTTKLPEGQSPWYSSISVDDREEERRATAYLIEQGHRRIAMITEGLHELSVGHLRFEGYRDALREAGIGYDPALVAEGTAGIEHYSFRNGYEAAKKLLESGAGFTALLCGADVFALGACRAIFESGRRVPQDISVVGYDGIETGEYYNPPLTTVCQPIAEMAEATAELLFDVIAKRRSHENLILPARLVVRGSSGPAEEEA